MISLHTFDQALQLFFIFKQVGEGIGLNPFLKGRSLNARDTSRWGLNLGDGHSLDFRLFRERTGDLEQNDSTSVKGQNGNSDCKKRELEMNKLEGDPERNSEFAKNKGQTYVDSPLGSKIGRPCQHPSTPEEDHGGLQEPYHASACVVQK